ncbi:MAG TPA: hypothetical protein VK157_00205, partial [Phycisphaerales bacterium]|nr:hypothetical protein [Phycisphaerales bacterium]
YQGRLDFNGVPANGVYDMQFRLYDSATLSAPVNQLGNNVCVFDVNVVNGVFTANVDFGALYTDNRWLEIRVRADGSNTCNGLNTVAPLANRQFIASAPRSVFSQSTRGITLDAAGNFASRGGSDPIPLAIAHTSADEWLSLRSQAGTERWRVMQGSSGELSFRNSTGSNLVERVRFGNSTGNALTVTGTTTTQVLTITGGADIAEPFNVHTTEGTTIVPGMVVSIDPARTGELRVSDAAYDRTVAGIISGANGVNPGLTLTQAGTVADGKHPVALTGRVWVLADATNGPITAGDLLTTSDTPGHAMKAGDASKSAGATIGKAMSSLESGKGYVLVLVNLH